jgi:hypothetical protein
VIRPYLIAALAALAVSNCSPRSQRCSLHGRRLRRILLQIGGANIAGADRAWSPPTSSSFADDERVGCYVDFW